MDPSDKARFLRLEFRAGTENINNWFALGIFTGRTDVVG